MCSKFSNVNVEIKYFISLINCIWKWVPTNRFNFLLYCYLDWKIFYFDSIKFSIKFLSHFPWAVTLADIIVISLPFTWFMFWINVRDFMMSLLQELLIYITRVTERFFGKYWFDNIHKRFNASLIYHVVSATANLCNFVKLFSKIFYWY